MSSPSNPKNPPPSSKNDTANNNNNNDHKNNDSSGTTAERRQRTIAYLLFGIDLNEGKAPSAEAAPDKTTFQQQQHHNHIQQQRRKPTDGDTTENITSNSTSTTYHHKLNATLDEIDRHVIPMDRLALRQTRLFATTLLPALQWQRDNYMVGPEYANWRKRDKERGRRGIVHSPPSTFRIPYSSQAMVHAQLRPILIDFIPSETVIQALTPIVADLPSGILYDTISSATIELIQFQRTNLNYTFKEQLLSVLKDQAIRDQMKASMQGLMIQKSESTRSDG